jgi:alpha-glucosidase
MQWDSSAFAGFLTVEPWLPISNAFPSENVETELGQPSSIYHLYRRLISARRQQPALSGGSYRRILTERDLLLYIRQAGSARILIALNFGSEATSISLPPDAASGEVLVSSFGDRDLEKVTGRIELRADEGLVIEALQA